MIGDLCVIADLFVHLAGRVRRIDVALPPDVSTETVAALRELLAEGGELHIANCGTDARRVCDLVFCDGERRQDHYVKGTA